MPKIKVVMFDVSGLRRVANIEGFTVEEVSNMIYNEMDRGSGVLSDSEGRVFNLRNIVQINAPEYIESEDI